MKQIIASVFVSLIGAGHALAQAAAETAEIRLAAQPGSSLSAQRSKPVELSSKHASKFRILPGIADSSGVSFELVGAKGFFMRHQDSILFVHERPKLVPLFNADATFKMIHVTGDGVRFETINYPGKFITVRDDGAVRT